MRGVKGEGGMDRWEGLNGMHAGWREREREGLGFAGLASMVVLGWPSSMAMAMRSAVGNEKNG